MRVRPLGRVYFWKGMSTSGSGAGDEDVAGARAGRVGGAGRAAGADADCAAEAVDAVGAADAGCVMEGTAPCAGATVASNTRLEKAASSAVRIEMSLVVATGAAAKDTRVDAMSQRLGYFFTYCTTKNAREV
jgi:hypothetical protein